MCHSNQVCGLQSPNSHLFVYETDAIKQCQGTDMKSQNSENIEEEKVQNPIYNEIISRIKENTLMTVLNFQIINYGLNLENTSGRQPRNLNTDDYKIVDS